MTDRIEKSVELRAPIDRMWQALTDYKEFGAWFRVAIEGPFSEGEPARGRMTHEGYEHVHWEVMVVAIERPKRFAFTWHPYAVDPEVDYTSETPTLVEFLLEPTATGTRLTVIESGFDQVPEHRHAEAMRLNDGGWTQQVENIRAYVGG